MAQRIIIIGGGLTGLTAAYRLQQQARSQGIQPDITVLERSQELGGKVQSELIDGVVVERGPDSFVASKPWLKELCAELGLPVVGTNPAIKRTYIYQGGRLEPLPAGMQLMVPTQIWPFVKTPLLSWRGKLRAAMEPLIARKTGAGDESIGSFVRRRFGSEVLEKVAGPLMAGIHGGNWDEISLKATFPMFMQMEAKGSLLLGARRGPKPKSGTGSAFLTVPGGLAKIIDALVLAAEDVRFRTGVGVVSISLEADLKTYQVRLESGELLQADAVVTTLPAYGTAALIAQLAPDAARELAKLRYSSSVVVALGYDRSQVPHPLDGSGFMVPRGEPTDVTAATWVSSKWPHIGRPDLALMRAFVGRSGGVDWAARTDEEILAAVRRDMQRIMGITAAPRFARVFRWRRQMVTYQVGHLDRVAGLDRQMSSLPGLVLAGAAYRGVGMPDCVREGNQAAERVGKHLGWHAAAYPAG